MDHHVEEAADHQAEHGAEPMNSAGLPASVSKNSIVVVSLKKKRRAMDERGVS